MLATIRRLLRLNRRITVLSITLQHLVDILAVRLLPGGSHRPGTAIFKRRIPIGIREIGQADCGLGSWLHFRLNPPSLVYSCLSHILSSRAALAKPYAISVAGQTLFQRVGRCNHPNFCV